MEGKPLFRNLRVVNSNKHGHPAFAEAFDGDERITNVASVEFHADRDDWRLRIETMAAYEVEGPGVVDRTIKFIPETGKGETRDVTIAELWSAIEHYAAERERHSSSAEVDRRRDEIAALLGEGPAMKEVS